MFYFSLMNFAKDRIVNGLHLLSNYSLLFLVFSLQMQIIINHLVYLSFHPREAKISEVYEQLV